MPEFVLIFTKADGRRYFTEDRFQKSLHNREWEIRTSRNSGFYVQMWQKNVKKSLSQLEEVKDGSENHSKKTWVTVTMIEKVSSAIPSRNRE